MRVLESCVCVCVEGEKDAPRKGNHVNARPLYIPITLK